MSEKHYSDQTLFEMASFGHRLESNWRVEWLRLFEKYRDLANKFEAVVENTADIPPDIFAIVRELTELSGESVNFEIWDHTPSYVGGDHNVEVKLYSCNGTQYFRGTTFKECEEKFRAAFAKPDILDAFKEESL